MPEQKSQVSMMTALSVIFTLIAIIAIVALVMLKSKADTAEETVSVNPEPPTFDSLTATTNAGAHDIIADNFIPVEGGRNTVHVTAQVSDPNGCSDISHVAIVLYSSSYDYTLGDLQWKSYSSDIPYTSAEHFTGCTGGDDLTAQIDMDYALTNFVNPGDWTIRVEVVDKTVGTTLSDVDTSNHFTVNTLAAFTTEGSIDYGTVALGAESLEKTLTFTNTGNVSVNTTVIASGDMTEPSGNFAVIPALNTHYSVTSSFAYADGAAVDKTTAQPFTINLVRQTVDLPGNIPTVPTYWKLLMPASGVNGSYSNTLTLTATAL